MRFAKRSSTRAAVLVGVVAAAALLALAGAAAGVDWLAYGGFGVAVLAAAALAITLLRTRQEEAERSRHADQLITAEQDERRRLALFLHDVPVQSMSGIALMLDGVVLARKTGLQYHVDLHVEVRVEDQGPGIRPDQMDRIFERFYTDRPDQESFGQNSGLGLSISKQIVEAHQGRIWVENIVKDGADGDVVGARFIVRIPAIR